MPKNRHAHGCDTHKQTRRSGSLTLSLSHSLTLSLSHSLTLSLSRSLSLSLSLSHSLTLLLSYSLTLVLSYSLTLSLLLLLWLSLTHSLQVHLCRTRSHDTNMHTNHLCVRAQPPRFWLQMRARVDRVFFPFSFLILPSTALRCHTLNAASVCPQRRGLFCFEAPGLSGFWPPFVRPRPSLVGS